MLSTYITFSPLSSVHARGQCCRKEKTNDVLFYKNKTFLLNFLSVATCFPLFIFDKICYELIFWIILQLSLLNLSQKYDTFSTTKELTLSVLTHIISERVERMERKRRDKEREGREREGTEGERGRGGKRK